MERTTSLTFLYARAKGTSGAYEKLIDITSYPDLFVAPENLDISDLSSNQKKYTPGMTDVPDYSFGFNYTKDAYDAVKEKDMTEMEYQLRFGEEGEYGCWEWSGRHFTSVAGGAVGAVRTGTVKVYVESEIEAATVNA